MRTFAISVLLLMTACDDASSDESSGVAGLWAWCDDDACSTPDYGALFFIGSRVLDASYDAEASTYCTYEEVGTFSVQGSALVITRGDAAGANLEETYTLDGSFLRGSEDLKRVHATAGRRCTGCRTPAGVDNCD